MKIACPKCHYATENVDIMLGLDDVGFIIHCERCKTEHILKVPMISCSELISI